MFVALMGGEAASKRKGSVSFVLVPVSSTGNEYERHTVFIPNFRRFTLYLNNEMDLYTYIVLIPFFHLGTKRKRVVC